MMVSGLLVSFHELVTVVSDRFTHRAASCQAYGDAIGVDFTDIGGGVSPACPEPISIQAGNVPKLVRQEEAHVVVAVTGGIKHTGRNDDHRIPG
jgi:hypothetical protein